MRHPGGRGDRGQASAFLIGVLLLGLALAGLAVDGGRMFTVRRDLSAIADAAALAGAGAIDEEAYRASDGEDAHLDPDRARLEVARVLRASPAAAGARVDVVVDAQRVTVHLAREVPTTLLGAIGVDARTIGATATAEPAVR